MCVVGRYSVGQILRILLAIMFVNGQNDTSRLHYDHGDGRYNLPGGSSSGGMVETLEKHRKYPEYSLGMIFIILHKLSFHQT